MKLVRNTVFAVGAILSLLALQGVASSAEQSAAKEGTSKKSSSRTLAQMVEEVRNSINEGWRKLTDPKTVEPARNKVNEVYKELSGAVAASGSSDKSKKDTRDKKDN